MGNTGSIHYRFFRLLLFFLAFTLFPYNAYAFNLKTEDLIPERRKDQFPPEFAWYLIPFPYNYPGIGSGIFLMAAASNIFSTNTDVFAGYATGDVGGKIFSLQELHLIPETLFIGVDIQDLDKLVLQNYEKRGMDTKQDEFKLFESDKLYGQKVNMTLSFWERRLEFQISHQMQNFQLSRIRDSGGALIADLTEPYRSTSSRITSSLQLDFTDDLQDPRKGARFEISWIYSPRESTNDPEYYVMNYNTKFYYPIGRYNTLAFNYFHSYANVTRDGTTDRDALIDQIGLNCTEGDAECEQTQEDLIQQFIDQNTNGSSASLGGIDRLRSYGDGRFKGAHTSFLAVEFRWNLTEEFTPFNYFIWQDTRTGVQVAFFAETGSVSETAGELWNQSRSSYGAGLRMVTGSGFVYRFDIAVGDEGMVPILWFFYPW